MARPNPGALQRRPLTAWVGVQRRPPGSVLNPAGRTVPQRPEMRLHETPVPFSSLIAYVRAPAYSPPPFGPQGAPGRWEVAVARLRVDKDGKAAKGRDRRISQASSNERKQIILATVRIGHTIDEGCRQAGCVRSTYDYYRKTDPDFRDLIDKALQAKLEKAKGNRVEVPDFPEFW